MKNTRVVATQKSVNQVNTDLLVFCGIQKDKQIPVCDSIVKDLVAKAFDLGDFTGKSGEQLMVYSDTVNTDIHAKRLLVIGMGNPETDADRSNDSCAINELLREIGGSVAKVCAKIKIKDLVISLPDIGLLSVDKTAQYLCEGLLLGDYRFAKYKENTKKKDDYTGLKTIRFASAASVKAIRKGIKNGLNTAQAACQARDMANEPGNGWTSKEFAMYANNLAKEQGLTYTCLEKKDLEKQGMGGILAVNQGSAIPPRMVILEYKPPKKSDTILLVGKGITFDSGGISLKPAGGMEEMKYDMCGGAAVLTAMQAVAAEKPDVGVVAIVPATDNMSGSSAVRPGDIIRHYNGVTAEIVNTDAEGRMVLGDALAYGIKKYAPDCVIDIATLTGAVIMGLGHHYTGLIGNNDTLCELLISAGKKAGEPIWRLPLTKEYKKQIESKVADIKNIGGKPAGSITAAAYLSNFVGKTPWAHLDIAGTAWDFTEKSYIPKGPSGIGVRTFLYLIRSWKKGMLKE